MLKFMHVVPQGVTAIVTCTPCATIETHKKGTFLMVRHDMSILRLGYQKHERSEKRVAKLIL